MPMWGIWIGDWQGSFKSQPLALFAEYKSADFAPLMARAVGPWVVRRVVVEIQETQP